MLQSIRHISLVAGNLDLSSMHAIKKFWWGAYLSPTKRKYVYKLQVSYQGTPFDAKYREEDFYVGYWIIAL